MKQKVKVFVDIIMYLLFIYLMSYHAGNGLWLHGVAGTTVFVLFIVHHGLNLQWYRGIRKGTYTMVRGLYMVFNCLLFLDMVVMAVSSLMMAGRIFAFMPFYANYTVQMLHLLSASWGFVLMAFHLGLHTHKWLERLYHRMMESFFGYSYILLFLLVLMAGIYCFISSGLWNALFLMPDRGMPIGSAEFYVKYVMITLAACQMVHLLLRIVKK